MDPYRLKTAGSPLYPHPGFSRTPLTTLLIFLVLYLAVSTYPAAGQTKWFKYDGNPVLDLGPPGSWDDAWAWVDKVIFDGSIYRMWYHGYDQTTYRIGYATSTDGVTWQKHLRPVLNPGPAGSWDSVGVIQAEVVFHRSKYHMWYNTIGTNPVVKIGYASSLDGIAWKKHPDPVLGLGVPGSWDGTGICKPSVIPSGDGFHMWYSGWNTRTLSDMRIGLAVARDETTWVRPLQTPVLLPGAPGQWDEEMLAHSRVIFDGGRYQMYFTAGPRYAGGPIGRAVSTDGSNWQKSPSDDPVMRGGEPGSWDERAMSVGGILFDGTYYHMWYGGENNGTTWRTGYALSPSGLESSVEIMRDSSLSGADSIRITVRTPEPARKSFAAALRMPDCGLVAIIPLFDDGVHHDSLAGDGFFAGTWHPQENEIYVVDLKMKMRMKERSMDFTMRNASSFSTIRHVSIEGPELLMDQSPNPGDTLFFKLILRHKGTLTTIPEVTTSLNPGDLWTSDLRSDAPSYGDLAPGSSARTSGYYRLFVKPECPRETDVRLNATVFSRGVPFLTDTMTFRVSLPWWRSPWALGVFATFTFILIFGSVRYMAVRKMRDKIVILEREHALERERTRIAQDMHDEVGSALSEIAILSELAQKRPEKTAEHVQDISERTAEVIDNVSEMVWALNPRNDTMDNLIGHLRRYAVTYLESAGISCEFIMPEMIPPDPLRSEFRRSVFLAVREALHCIVRHAGAGTVNVEVLLLKTTLEVRIQDNRQPLTIEGNSAPISWPADIQQRLAGVGGQFHVEVHPEDGIRVAIVVPFSASAAQ